MKKAGKRVVFGSLLLVVLMFTMTFTVFAARDIPKKVRTRPNSSSYLYLTLNRCEYIKITSAKGLNTKIVSERWATQSSTSSTTIRYSTKKAGDYKLVFNIYDALTKKKKTSATITIYSREDNPIKKVLINGKDANVSTFFRLNNYKKSSFTFKVQMNSGYTLKKLEYLMTGKQKTTTTKNGNMTETITENPSIIKQFKNGGSVPVSKYTNGMLTRDREVVYESGETDKWHEMWELSGDEATLIRITYLDKYTKEELVCSYYVFFENN